MKDKKIIFNFNKNWLKVYKEGSDFSLNCFLSDLNEEELLKIIEERVLYYIYNEIDFEE